MGEPSDKRLPEWLVRELAWYERWEDLPRMSDVEFEALERAVAADPRPLDPEEFADIPAALERYFSDPYR